MATYTVSVAAATAVVGYNLLANYPHARQSGHRRVLRTVACAGSAAAGDTRLAVLVGASEVGDTYNLATGFPTRDHVERVMVNVPPNEEVSVIVRDAPATNPINVRLEFDG